MLVRLGKDKTVIDFGAVEIQAVYISGNVRNVFEKYMEHPAKNALMEWPTRNYPKPDYLSSSRKRLAPQLIFKGGILNQWNKKMAVAVHRGFFEQLPKMESVSQEDADIAWMIYDLKFDTKANVFGLKLSRLQYTKFQTALNRITVPEVGDIQQFTKSLETRVRNRKLFGEPPESSIEPSVEPVDL